MRVLVVDTYYPAFVAAHYDARPGLAARSYDEQLGSLVERSFGTSDAYSRNFAELGHDAADVIVNATPLQRAWAREHGASRLARVAMRLPARGRVAARQ